MEMPCGCTIEDQYLPLRGGERLVECPHAKYTIEGKRVTGMKFNIINIIQKGIEEDDETSTE